VSEGCVVVDPAELLRYLLVGLLVGDASATSLRYLVLGVYVDDLLDVVGQCSVWAVG
jgi:hypothetical protein